MKKPMVEKVREALRTLEKEIEHEEALKLELTDALWPERPLPAKGYNVEELSGGRLSVGANGRQACICFVSNGRVEVQHPDGSHIGSYPTPDDATTVISGLVARTIRTPKPDPVLFFIG